jgi:hypothetical protein
VLGELFFVASLSGVKKRRDEGEATWRVLGPLLGGTNPEIAWRRVLASRILKEILIFVFMVVVDGVAEMWTSSETVPDSSVW